MGGMGDTGAGIDRAQASNEVPVLSAIDGGAMDAPRSRKAPRRRPPVDRSNVGVLFVHGAGEHRQGGTLLSFGQPIADWLEGWLRNDPGRDNTRTQVEYDSAQLVSRPEDSPSPAHATIQFIGADGKPHRWLLAESWWDEAFPPPAFREVLLWALLIVPWVVGTQFLQPLIATFSSTPNRIIGATRAFLEGIVSLTLAVALAAILQALSIVLLLLSIVPVPALRDAIGGVLRWVSGSVGDLFIVVVSPLQRATLSGAVARDISWLRRRGSPQIVVVAHSQGAYVAYRALTDKGGPSVDKLITLGSGLVRLMEAVAARKSGALVGPLAITPGLALTLAFGLPTAIAWAFGGSPASIESKPLGVLGAILLFIGVGSIFGRSDTHADAPRTRTWTDYLASADPVVNGRPGRRVEGSHSVEVQNKGSVLADHSGYWSNMDEFVAAVVLEIASLDPGADLEMIAPPVGGTASLIGVAKARRAFRVRLLVLSRLVLMAAAFLVLVRTLFHQPGEFAKFGSPVLDSLQWLAARLPSWVGDTWKTSVPTGALAESATGALVFSATVWIAYRCSVLLWGWWGRQELQGLWRRSSARRGAVELGIFVLYVAVLAALLIAGTIAGGLGGVRTAADALWQAHDAVLYNLAYLTVGILIVAALTYVYRPRDVSAEEAVGVLTLATVVAVVVAGSQVMPLAEDGIVALPSGLALGAVSLYAVIHARTLGNDWLERISTQPRARDVVAVSAAPAGAYASLVAVVSAAASAAIWQFVGPSGGGAVFVLSIATYLGVNATFASPTSFRFRALAFAAAGVAAFIFLQVLNRNWGAL